MAKKPVDTSPKFKWLGASAHIPNWVIPNNETNTLEPGVEYTLADVPDGFAHPDFVPLEVDARVLEGGE